MFIEIIEKSKIFKMDDILKTKDGYVKSMKIYKKLYSHLMLLSLSKNEEITAEIMQVSLLYKVLSGDSQFQIEDKTVDVKAGESIYIEKGQSYSVKSLEDTQLLELALNDREAPNKFIKLKKSEAFKMEDEIEYEDYKILSKTLALNKNLILTVMSFSEDQELAAHTAPGDALIEVLDGDGIFTIDDVDFTLTKGESIILPANIPHAVKSITKFKMLLCLLK